MAKHDNLNGQIPSTTPRQVSWSRRRPCKQRRAPHSIFAVSASEVPSECHGRGSRHPQHLGATLPGPGFTTTEAFVIEAVLSLGLVSTILGTASTAQNLGPISALGVAAYIALAGLWASPVSGASMNPARSLGPALVSTDFHDLWIYLTAPLAGALIGVGFAYVLRGPGGGPGGTRAAQGTLQQSAPPHKAQLPGCVN